MKALYNIEKSYAENFQSGPLFQGEIPKRPPPSTIHNFLGHTLRSRLGIPAGPLLNAQWIALAAKLGFDLLTYKTIRSFAHPGHPVPNIVYASPSGATTMRQAKLPTSLDELTITNSFGMPSQSPEFLLQDIAAANASLAFGQLLIVSIVGSPTPERSLLEDFIQTACLAKDAGAKVIEANFSCPNVQGSEGCLYMSPSAVYEYAHKIARAIHPIPLILKVGLFPDVALLHQTLVAAARATVQAICGLNSVSRELTPPLDPQRKSSGVCGAAIRPLALEFLRNASRINREEGCGLTLLGCGGILRPEHFEEFFAAGADVALSATGMLWNPYLVSNCINAHSLAASKPLGP